MFLSPYIFIVLLSCSVNSYRLFKSESRSLSFNGESRCITTLQPLQVDTNIEHDVAQLKSASPKHYLALLSVAFLWGTYSPLVKTVFSSVENTPSVIVFNLLSYIISFAALLVCPRLTKTSTAEVNIFDTSALKPGFELGLWLFIGSYFQVLGIQQTSASRAAILIQSTTFLVPLFQMILNKVNVSKQLWFSCFIAFIGIGMILLDRPMEVLVGGTFIGDSLICVAAIFYALHVVRLGNVASIASTSSLALFKCLSELIYSTVAFIFIMIKNKVTNTPDDIFTFFHHLSWNNDLLVVLFVLLWNGVLTTAYTTWAQYYAQKEIPATQSNLILSMQPLWAAIFSFIILGDRLSENAIFGFIILCASVVISSFDSLRSKDDPSFSN